MEIHHKNNETTVQIRDEEKKAKNAQAANREERQGDEDGEGEERNNLWN